MPLGLGGRLGCELHRSHRPAPLTSEEHHIVPQAWQSFWAPFDTSFTHGKPWDPRTATLCPTGHRNVHFHLVEFMKAGAIPHRRLTAEEKMAVEAMTRWKEWGGDLEELRRLRAYGYA